MTSEQGGLRDWNVLVTVYEEEFRQACRLLRQFGAIAPSDFHNVITMRVEDPTRFTEALGERIAADPGILNSLSRVVPAALAFDFRDAGEFEEQARIAVRQLVPRLAGCSFHVRMHRRGFRHRISSKDEEQLLDKVILDALEAAGTPGSITFEDPDAIVAIETVGQRAGVSLWTREDMRRYPFLRLD